MATAITIITRSMRLAGAIGKGETPDDDESADGLTALNAMLDSWQLERLMVYQIQEDSYTWTATQSRTVGSAGDFAQDLPIRVDPSSYFVVSNVSYPVIWLSQEDWAAITSKTTTAEVPQAIYVEYGTSTHTLYAYPTPSASLTFKLRSWQRLQSFSALTTELALPPGYERAIVFNLAMEFSPEFGAGRKIDPQVPLIASQSKASIKTINQPSMVAQLDSGVAALGQLAGGRWNIYSDGR